MSLSLSEAALPALIADDGLMERIGVEVGPISVAEIQFGVGCLPEQVVAESHFSSGAYEQVGVGHEGGLQIAGEGFLGEELVDVGGLEVGFLAQCVA